MMELYQNKFYNLTMKLPFTEKFLWDLYKSLKITNEALSKFASTRSKGIYGMANLFRFSDYSDIRKLGEKKLGKERFGRLIKYLKYNGYLYLKKEKNKEAVIITSKGAEKILTIKRKIEGLPKRKDGKWQMVIFDIPEDIRKRRDYFRIGLKRLKYQKLQQSIWVCPYDALEETEELLRDLKIESFVKILLIEEVKIQR